MAATAPTTPSDPPHIPVLIDAIVMAAPPVGTPNVSGRWLDGTFGAGGYTRALLEAGADHVTAIDRDPSVFDLAASWAGSYGERLTLVEGTFSTLDAHIDAPLDGIVLDLGVSSMQLDQADRGFSFSADGPLDMRMGQDGPTASDLVNTADEASIADILYQYGEERASRRIARAIVAARSDAPIVTTAALARIIEKALPPRRKGQSHPATRSFQAIRIAINNEFNELIDGLESAERALKPGGFLAVVSFHSLEDRVVKRFFRDRASTGQAASRYAPDAPGRAPGFTAKNRAIAADADEVARNPRARSAQLRTGLRTDAPAMPADRAALGLPKHIEWGGTRA